ncbi:hypothetical protein EU545_05495 [Candidatus Thorarchaeota archaeon]|nr:MAG: hypothetical protein EU545_05495 [Candidatus Thorarchaeota archaeon]
MDEEHARYPRRGEYGDPSRRCAWCGKRFESIWTTQRYCSWECAAADKYTEHICLAGCLTSFLVFSVVLLFLFPSLLPGNLSGTLLAISITLWCTIGLCVFYRLWLARPLREREKEAQLREST